MTVLLVEDEYLIAISETKALKNYGYNVTLVKSGEDALDILRTQNFDIILMDINLGNGITGTEAAEIILIKYDVPIIFLSSHTEKEVVEKTEKITSYGYVVKASSITVLDASIKMALKLFEEKRTTDKYQCELLAMEEELKLQLKNMEKAEILAKVGNWELDLNTNRIKGSLGARIMYGLGDDASFNYDDIHDRILPEYLEMSELALRNLVEKNIPYKVNVAIQSRDEIKKVVSIAEFDKDNNRVFGVIRDRTDIVNLVEQTEKNEKFLQTILENAPIGICVTDNNQNPIMYNKRLYEILQMTEEGLRRGDYKKRQYVRLDGTYKPADEMPTYRAMHENRIIEAMAIGIKKEDGDIIWVNVSAAPLDENSCVVLTNDITDRINSTKIREKEAELHDIILKTTMNGFWMIDLEGNILEVNESYCKMSGYSELELLRMKVSDLEYLESNDDILIRIEKTMKVGVDKFESKHKKKDGTPVDIECSLQYNNEYKFFVAFFRDITLENEAKKLLNKTIEEKEILLKEVHHRIKNNMFTIISLLSLQAHSTENTDIKMSLGDASSRISSMMVLYDKLYKSKSGAYDKVLLDAYIESILKEFKECYFASNGIIINRDIDDIELDIKLTQSLGIIINELLTNIAKYAFPYQENKIVDVSIKSNLNFLTLIISDNGIGLPKDFKFDESLGFGLQLISSLVESLKGTIKLDDEWKGTKVIIEFRYLG